MIRVQILADLLGRDGAVRKPAKRPGSNPGDRVRVRLPPALLKSCVGWASASLSGCNPPATIAVQVQLLPDALTRPVRLSAKDTGPSSRKDGFDSHTGYCRARQRKLTNTCGFDSHSRSDVMAKRQRHRPCKSGNDSFRDLRGKWPGGGTGRHAVLRRPCPPGVGVRLSPWSLDLAGGQVSGRPS